MSYYDYLVSVGFCNFSNVHLMYLLNLKCDESFFTSTPQGFRFQFTSTTPFYLILKSQKDFKSLKVKKSLSLIVNV